MPKDSSSQPGLTCWYCKSGLSLEDVLRDGILRSRAESDGGPYRLHACPVCQHFNRCERSLKGRWFSSPNFRPNLFDYLLGRLFVAQPADFLHAVTWYRENEERRRYFFERDGDSRYSGGGLFFKLWPLAREGKEMASRRSRRDDPEGPREKRQQPRDRVSSRQRIASPYEILGLEKGAREADIRRAFHRLAVQYHPDKVHHLGDEFQKVATQKFKNLQKAYEALIRRQGP